MSNKQFKLEIVSAERSLYVDFVSALMITGSAGELGIHPGHTALLTTIKPGQIKLQLPGGAEEVFFISGGMLEVQPDIVTILADTAIRAADLDEAAALEAKERAEKSMHDKQAKQEYGQALVELAHAMAQLRAIQMLRKGERH